MSSPSPFHVINHLRCSFARSRTNSGAATLLQTLISRRISTYTSAALDRIAAPGNLSNAHHGGDDAHVAILQSGRFVRTKSLERHALRRQSITLVCKHHFESLLGGVEG